MELNETKQLYLRDLPSLKGHNNATAKASQPPHADARGGRMPGH